MTLKIELTSELEQRLAKEAERRGVPAATLTIKLLDEYLPAPARQNELVSLLKSWVEEGDSQEQRETGEYLIRSLDEDRLSDRKTVSTRAPRRHLVSRIVLLDAGAAGQRLANKASRRPGTKRSTAT